MNTPFIISLLIQSLDFEKKKKKKKKKILFQSDGRRAPAGVDFEMTSLQIFGLGKQNGFCQKVQVQVQVQRPDEWS